MGHTGLGWDEITLRLGVRSGGLCEARTPACLARPCGRLADRPDRRLVAFSRHHRVPRGSGGTSDEAVDELHRLLLLCGDGTTGCHGYVEQYRAEAYRRGLLVHKTGDAELTDRIARAAPLELASGRLVALDAGVFYRTVGWASSPRPAGVGL